MKGERIAKRETQFFAFAVPSRILTSVKLVKGERIAKRETQFFVFAVPSRIPQMVTTQVVLDCEATCGPSVCGIYFNTNHTNLTNCAGLTSNKETI